MPPVTAQDIVDSGINLQDTVVPVLAPAAEKTELLTKARTELAEAQIAFDAAQAALTAAQANVDTILGETNTAMAAAVNFVLDNFSST